MIGTIITLVPTVGYTWPALLPILMAQAAVLGYKAIDQDSAFSRFNKVTRQLQETQLISLDLKTALTERGVVLNVDIMTDELGNDRMLRFQKGDITLVFKQDTRGKLHVDVLGPNKIPKADLKREATEFAGRVIQAFAANRIVQELEKTNAVVVDQKTTDEQDIVLTLRRWV